MNLSDSQCTIHFFSEIVIAKVFFFLSYIYWADWNRDAPKIEMAYMDGTNRRVLAKDDLGLPNGLTYDPQTSLLCWADAGRAPETFTSAIKSQLFECLGGGGESN